MLKGQGERLKVVTSEGKTLPCELRLPVPFGLPARQAALVQAGLGQNW